MSVQNILKLAKKFEKRAFHKDKAITHIDNIITSANDLKNNIEDPEAFLDILASISEDFDELLEYGNILNEKMLKGEVE